MLPVRIPSLRLPQSLHARPLVATVFMKPDIKRYERATDFFSQARFLFFLNLIFKLERVCMS
jgi:hypothetical protein